MIELSHVDAGYRGALILKDVNLMIDAGEVFVLLGGSGCGKTTLMRHMIGLNPVLSGRLTVSGLEWGPKTRGELCRRIGVMYQSGALFGSMTLLENVMLPMEEFTRQRRREREERAAELLADVGLADAGGKLPSEISGGMRKRAAIARAMALDAESIFLDEPSAGLDPITSAALDELILKLRQERGKTFVIVTHELASVRRIADRCAMFDKSRKSMVALGTPAFLQDRCEDEFVRRYFNAGGIHV